jgi:hypothetical protein
MTYKILSTRQNEESLYTLVEYNFGGTIIIVDVAHFAPKSVQEIEQNIKNRASTELYKIQASEQLSTIIADIPIAVEKPIE